MKYSFDNVKGAEVSFGAEFSREYGTFEEQISQRGFNYKNLEDKVKNLFALG
jgi:hypothetical protein